MLEKKRVDRLHGMGDDRWKTKDKLTQYRGLIKFFAREQKQHIYENAHLRRKQLKEIRELRKDIKYFRNVLYDSLFGDKQRLRNSLQQHRRIQLAFQGLMPPRVVEHIKQVNHTKLKELDRLHYKKKQKMAELMRLQLQVADLQDSNELFNREKQRYAEQVVTNKIQNVRVRYNASVNINKTYKNIIDILKQDSLYFDTVLQALQADSFAQSCCIIQATRMGQEATEHLANIHEDYRILEKQVKENMRQRDLAVKALRKEVQNLYHQCLGLVRIESDTDMLEKQGPSASELALPRELGELEEILTEIQVVTHVSAYDDIFPRIKDQLHQKNRLTHQLEQNVATRDSFLTKRNHAELMFASLETTMADTTFYYKEEKARLLKEIAVEEENMKKKKAEVEERGDLLVMLRCSLQTLNEMVARINDESDDSILEIEETLASSKPVTPVLSTPMLEDAQEILKLVAAKMDILTSLMPQEPDDMTKENAKASYQRQMADTVSRIAFASIQEYDLPLVDLEEIEDASVPTRTEIKQRSQDLVDQIERPAEMEMQIDSRIPQASTAGKQKRRGKWT